MYVYLESRSHCLCTHNFAIHNDVDEFMLFVHAVDITCGIYKAQYC